VPDPLYGTPAGFAALAAEADRRRVRSLTTACVASLLVVGVLGGVQSVRSRADGASQRLVSPPSDGTPVEPAHGHGGGPVALPAAHTPSLGGPGQVPVTGGHGGSPSPRPAPSPAPVHPGPQSDPITRLPGYYKQGDVHRPCRVVYRTCTTTSTPVQDKDGRWVVEGLVCATSVQPSSVIFTSRPEVAFVVTASDGTQVWTSLKDHPADEDPHGETIPAGECVAYRTTWTGRHNDGTPLAAGDYQLGLTPLVQDPVSQFTTPFTMP
jgi:hypothetical protein